MPKVLKLKNENQVGKMEIKNLSKDKAELYLYGDIVSSEWGKWESTDTCPEDVRLFLEEIQDVNHLDIYINSGGGSVFAGMSIYNMLKRNKAYKIAHVDGLAGSIASMFPFVADEIFMPSNSYMMIHKPWVYTYGNSNELKDMANTLDTIEEGILNVYEANLNEGVTIEEIKELVNKGTWLTGEQAAKYFNKIKVEEENEAVACASGYFAKYDNVPGQFKNQEPIPAPAKSKEEIEKEKKISDCIKNTSLFLVEKYINS